MVLPLNEEQGSSQMQSEVEQVNYNIITLTRFLTEEQSKVKEATGDFT
jgi:fructose-1,6-bisphosphatase I